MSAKCRIYLVPHRDKGLTDLFIRLLFKENKNILFVTEYNKADAEIDISDANGQHSIREEAKNSAAVIEGIRLHNANRKKNAKRK